MDNNEEIIERISVSDLSKMVNNELNSAVDNINKNAQIMIDAGLPKLVRNHFESRHHEDGEPYYDYDETNLWNIVSHKYLAKYDIPNQALWEKYKAMDVLHEKNLAAFNKIEQPSKLNIVGRYLYHRKEKKLKIEEISAEHALEEFRISDHKLEERIMNLNQVDDKDVFVLYDKIQAAMYAYSSLNQFKIEPLKTMKEKIDRIGNQDIYIEGNYKNIDNVIDRAPSIYQQLNKVIKLNKEEVKMKTEQRKSMKEPKISHAR